MRSHAEHGNEWVPGHSSLANHRQFISFAARAFEQLVRFVAVGETLGLRVPFQRLADAADVADDVHQVAERGRPLADLDVGVAGFAALDALDPVLDVIGRLGPLVVAGIVRRLDEAPSDWWRSCRG